MNKKIGASPHKTRTKKAFTMVEMMLVIVVIGLLFTLLISNMDFSGIKAKTAAVKTDIMVIQLGLQDIASRDSGFPDSIELLGSNLNKMGLEKVDTHVEVDNATNIQYLDAGRVDPWGHPYRIYLCNAGGETSTAAIVCAGVDGEYMSEDDMCGSVTYTADGKYGRVTSEETEGGPIHAIGGWKIEVAATCTTPGKKIPICGICGLVMSDQSVVIPAEHQLITVDGTPATCTSDGTTSAQVCSVCGATISASSSIPMLPHDFTPWQLASQGATCIWVHCCNFCNTTEWDTTDSPMTVPSEEQVIPFSPVTPVKAYPKTGDRITMNLDGQNKSYYVITVNGTKATVIAPSVGNMGSNNMFVRGFGKGNKYLDSNVDQYLNETYYQTMTAAAKNAIVDCNVEQQVWTATREVSSTDKYINRSVYNDSEHDCDYYLIEGAVLDRGVRHIRTLSVRDVMICCRISLGDQISSAIVKDMIGSERQAWLINPCNCSEVTSTGSGYTLILTTKATNNAVIAYGISGLSGVSLFPVFDIDLSKIAFTKS